MKDYKPRYEELYKYYQVWLTDFTKLTVRSGIDWPHESPDSWYHLN